MTGGCHCGAIAYTLSTEPLFTFTCHCDNCRKLNGGSRLAAASFPREALTVRGTPRSYTYAGGKGEIDLRFCETCSTPLFALTTSYPEVAIVRLNSLTDQEAIAPRKHMFREQACAWDELP